MVISFLINTLVVGVALLTAVIAYFKNIHSYWKSRNVPVAFEPTIPFGHSENMFKKRDNHLAVIIKNHYDKIKTQGHKYFGMYATSSKLFVPIDLDIVKLIMAKDFNCFVDRGNFVNEKDDPISAHLFNIGGVKWKNLRAKLTPTFTSGKMKMMFPTLVECGEILDKTMSDVANKNEPIDIKEVLGCFTTDIIGSVAFGIDCNTFKDTESPFRKYGKKVFEVDFLRILKFTVIVNFPTLAKMLHFRTTPKDVSDFFTNMVRKTIKYREENNCVRKDFLQILIDLNKEAEGKGGDGKSLTFEEMVAQSFVFFIAGFETSSTTMTFALYELSKHQEIQNKLRKEINDVLARHNGQITYESINDMKYMNQVIDETLRKYPPLGFVTRKCLKDYNIPDSDVTIEEGTRVFIPILAVHYDKEYYPEPENFNPDRFTEEKKQKMNQYTHMAFGEGPRVCIGQRFGLMQTKVGLTILLKNHRFTVNKKTHETFKFDPEAFILTALGGVWLDTQKIN